MANSEKITYKTCRRYGEKKLIDGLQYENVWFSCKDRRNCPYCRNTYVYVSGRYKAVKSALSDGAVVYTLDDTDWGAIKKQADRNGVKDNKKPSNSRVLLYTLATPVITKQPDNQFKNIHSISCFSLIITIKLNK